MGPNREELQCGLVVDLDRLRRLDDDIATIEAGGAVENWTLDNARRSRAGLVAAIANKRAILDDLVVLDTGELGVVTLRRAPGAIAPHGVRRWSERLGRLLAEEGVGEGRLRGRPAAGDPRVARVREKEGAR